MVYKRLFLRFEQGFVGVSRARGRLCRSVLSARHGFVAALLLGLVPPLPAGGQTPPTEEQQRERKGELSDVVDRLQRSEAEQLRLRGEIDGLKGDRARLNADLLKTADAVRKAEDRISESQGRLDEAMASEGAMRRSLDGRRDTIAEVLAALQRMGRRPPPAVVVRPEDMLEAIRAAILLGHVLPEIRGEVDKLVADLTELTRLREAAAAERQTLQKARDSIAAERTRLTALVEARQLQLEISEGALKEERTRIETLGRQAQSLKDLIARADGENQATQRALDQARKAPQAARSAQELAALASAAFKDPARLQPKIAFSDARGLLSLPASGEISKAFGSPDGYGGSERGITIAAGPESLVTAPSDGWVLFAGPYRSYGRVLIINAGNGYTFVLTGLHHTSVEIGQFVLAGEPVGTMGALTVEGMSADGGTGRLPLYVELRKDNQPIDPSPWWARNLSEKARG